MKKPTKLGVDRFLKRKEIGLYIVLDENENCSSVCPFLDKSESLCLLFNKNLSMDYTKNRNAHRVCIQCFHVFNFIKAFKQ